MLTRMRSRQSLNGMLLSLARSTAWSGNDEMRYRAETHWVTKHSVWISRIVTASQFWGRVRAPCQVTELAVSCWVHPVAPNAYIRDSRAVGETWQNMKYHPIIANLAGFRFWSKDIAQHYCQITSGFQCIYLEYQFRLYRRASMTGCSVSQSYCFVSKEPQYTGMWSYSWCW